MQLWKTYLIGFGLFFIFSTILAVLVHFSSTISVDPAYLMGEMIAIYLINGSMAFVIYWGIGRFIHNKALKIIIALIPVIILRLLVWTGSGFFN